MVTRITQTNLKTIQTHQPTAVGRGPYRGRLKRQGRPLDRYRYSKTCGASNGVEDATEVKRGLD